ncbi:MAG: MarR family transcriptional regulator [Burkholderiales bacterium]|nr:MarR family transcriptional regulator [Burkholderiales bacterium]
MKESTPQLDANESTGFLLWQVNAIWQRNVAAVLRVHDLTQVQFALLASLMWLEKREDWVTQAMLARHAKLDEMMTSQVLRSLEKRGLIERHPHPRDTRAKHLLLTADGRVKTAEALPKVEMVDMEYFAVLANQRKDFNQALRTLIERGVCHG